MPTSDDERPDDQDALVTAVRNGDILIFNGSYNHERVSKIKKLYEEATQGIGDQKAEIRGR